MRNNHNINVDNSACIGCGLCVKDCPAFNIDLIGKKANIKSQDCIKCGHCVAICPQNAVYISGFDDEPESLIPEQRLNSNELLYAIKSRRSIRHFLPQKIDSEILDQIINAGGYTPTAKNMQDVSYIILDEQKNLYEEAALGSFRKAKKCIDLFSKKYRNYDMDDHFLFKNAPIVILVAANNIVDGTLASANMALMAEANGLGVLYSGFFVRAANYSHRIKKMLKLPPKKRIVAALVIGYPAVKYQRTAPKEKPLVNYK